MKTLKLIALISLAFTFSRCKTSSPTQAPTSTAPLLPVAQTLDTVHVQFLRYADSTNGNARAALERTAKWLRTQPKMQYVSVLDSSYLYFTLQSGLTGFYFLNEVDNNGISLARGGKGGRGSLHKWDILSKNKIKNSSVLIFAPVFSEFYNAAEFQKVLGYFTDAGVDFTVTVKKNAECTSDVVDHFGDYGFVLIDTHGAPNGFLIGTEISDTLDNSEAGLKLLTRINMGNSAYDKFQAGQIMLARGLTYSGSNPGWQDQIKPPSTYPFRVVLTSKYVAGLPNLNGTVIFANMCYSGQSQPVIDQGVPTPIQTAFSSLNPISYYGYAHASGNASRVSNEFAKQMEASFLQQLITNTDSTGHCYLKPDGTEYYDEIGLKVGYSTEKLFFKHFGAVDYSYNDCIKEFVDDRDGEKYKAVCIGKQNWMAENLRYNAPGSKCYGNDPKLCVTYGKLYDWNTVMNGAASTNAAPSNVQGICPKGWHVPSQTEWLTLANYYGPSYLNANAFRDTLLWVKSTFKATNISGFSALPGGFNNMDPDYTGGVLGFLKIFSESHFWTTVETDHPQSTIPYSIEITLSAFLKSVGVNGAPKENFNSCRCLKD